MLGVEIKFDKVDPQSGKVIKNYLGTSNRISMEGGLEEVQQIIGMTVFGMLQTLTQMLKEEEKAKLSATSP